MSRDNGGCGLFVLGAIIVFWAGGSMGEAIAGGLFATAIPTLFVILLALLLPTVFVIIWRR